MDLYRPTDPEISAAGQLLAAHYPDAGSRLNSALLLVPALQYESCAMRNGYYQDHGIDLVVADDPGFWLPAPQDDRRNLDAQDATPRRYMVSAAEQTCQCWDYLASGRRCRHILALLAWREIVHAHLNILARRGALLLRPAGRYENLHDATDVWGATVCGLAYSPRTDKWWCETDRDLAHFAAWLLTDAAAAVIKGARHEDID